MLPLRGRSELRLRVRGQRRPEPPVRRLRGAAGVQVNFPKACHCGRSYDAAAWVALPLVGYYDDDVLDPDHPKATTLELRNCVCRSSLSVELPRRRAYTPPRVVTLAASDPRVQAMLREGR